MVAYGGLPVFKTEREHIIQAFLKVAEHSFEGGQR